ncbi:DUF5677 domain-containing protein [Vibrio brasiliensis]|uniref:DUF5677 domain-containing protein n=1 Tax=Vibrio brasiliensis TaxID=170652 RepID=UPI001EFC7CB5|nr:DUF5677 domain-containing protein [Vibrio brasiliensis]MCG9725467.1 DUF5677 domain-containing protein [Vibrio brasiliensis]
MGKRKKKGNLESHKKVGSKLVAPFNEIPNRTSMSWLNDRLPCMIWGGLLIHRLGRDEAIEVFRRISTELGEMYLSVERPNNPFPRIGLYGLSRLDNDMADKYFEILGNTPESKEALKSLKLLDCLPLSEKWAEFLDGTEVADNDWNVLAAATASLLDHQSQEATDCRWAYLLTAIKADRMVLMNAEQYQEFEEYPHFGEQRSVRPMIRSTEMSLGGGLGDEEYLDGKKKFADMFWEECKAKTDCFISKSAKFQPSYDVPATVGNVDFCWRELATHFLNTDTTTQVQAKRDASFGFGFYALAVAREGLVTSGVMLTSKMSLRILAEMYITFSYLIATGDKKLWDVYRSFGSSQAKLTFLKLEEVIEDKPGYLKTEHIEQLANEDIYMDFQDIPLGNWANIDLRKMSIVGKCKDIYDSYYTWPSTFAHGQWCAVRDTVYTTCLNPLHRLHRVPLPSPRYEDQTGSDIVLLVNKIFELIDSLYPGFKNQLSLEEIETKAEETVLED